ncbi:bZIP transcription factor-like protein [Arabidopsis thaliana]|uniref:Basic leucine zipper 25 n=1 Tax=Arabidopsis thaliana TaxID=3702 RepID=BZP25_ARATH|nr:basic leucine zipper 25 [Arabidopsis thaliana]Q9M1G6.1 RecName: Full=Basic leucine zipper 25; Short=AtbZIP25; Short=bZIP protein 25; AltName: Full=Basic leucine zipper OPAQUE 2 homolog 4; Short=Basic leucine zipper O2 homolog 4 [Arabidopsis thaliana]AAL09750.1 bZIP transcription factor-like protein [Arabidopsis thaliana]AEE79256.1 basic leucine zipper 25 [Arabidopsis thaliana]CAB77582.1 bZIP transcription factor-like protein [Arabidopsis thaliana]|eukprot:NP_567003.2 basic leucine zipper 25 [Arabidopsis thaliana]
MHIVFSVDDLTESFWPVPAPAPSPGSSSTPSPTQNVADGMTRSQSEWAFHRLINELSGSDSSPTTNTIERSPPPVQSLSRLEETVDETEDVVEIQKPQNHRRLPVDDQGKNRNRAPSSDPVDSSAPVVVDPNQYHAILKSKLELACAAVARRVGTVKPEDSSASASNQKQAQGSIVAQTSPGASSVRFSPTTSTQKKPDVPARQTSISSRDDSDDDDLDGDADNGDPTDVKRARRMLSNRESARRSRRRKQEQMNEFDTQVGQLRAEHSTLINRLSDMNHKYDAAAVDNRILRADIETLRTKVKMAEETVKRVTGVNPLHWSRPNMGIPFSNTPSASSSIPPNSNHILKPANSSTNTSAGLAQNQRVETANFLPEQVNREGMQNPFAPDSNLYETLPHWNHKH